MTGMHTRSGADLELPEDEDARRVAIKNVYPVEIKHAQCGGVVFYYRTLPVRGREFTGVDAMQIDGGRPVRISGEIHCPECHDEVRVAELTWRGKSW